MIRIHEGSILDCEVDVIVSPANSFLMNGAGLAGVIQRAATPRRADGSVDPAVDTYQREVRSAPLIPYGGAHLTSAGALPFKGIIHAVGPIWGGGDFFEKVLLMSAYDSCLRIAEQDRAMSSIAFPAISAGIFHCPIGVVAEAAICECKSTGLDVTFALMEDAHIQAFRKEMDRWQLP